VEISLEKLTLNGLMTSNQCLYHFDDVQSRAQLPYLAMLILAQSLRCQILLGLINNQLGGMWKELAVAYTEVDNITAFVVARNELCIKLITGKLKWPR
jgi:hypothetical protein